VFSFVYIVYSVYRIYTVYKGVCMNGTLNKVMLVGRLGDVPDLRYTKDGKPVANFSIATNRSWKNAAGEKEELTTWHRVACWNGTAEYAGKFLGKGGRVIVEGHLENREWTNKDGQKQYGYEVVASEVTNLEPRKKEEAVL
jgi:single-strand DNA-binding protein